MISTQQRAGILAFLALGAVWMLAMLTVEYVQAAQSGRGSGFGDGKLAPSLHTPGGPYYPDESPGGR